MWLYNVYRQILYVRCCPTIRTHDQALTKSSKIDSLLTSKRQVKHIRDFVLIPVIELCPARVVTRLEVMDRRHRGLLILCYDVCNGCATDYKHNLVFSNSFILTTNSEPVEASPRTTAGRGGGPHVCSGASCYVILHCCLSTDQRKTYIFSR